MWLEVIVMIHIDHLEGIQLFKRLKWFEFTAEAVPISSTRYTKEEKEKLKKYQALHGNDWMKISELMSRSNLSVAMKFSEIKSGM